MEKHPAASYLVRRRAEKQLGELQAMLPSAALLQLAEGKKTLELKQIVSGVLGDAV